MSYKVITSLLILIGASAVVGGYAYEHIRTPAPSESAIPITVASSTSTQSQLQSALQASQQTELRVQQALNEDAGTPIPKTSSQKSLPSGTEETYTSAQYGYTIQYPSTMIVESSSIANITITGYPSPLIHPVATIVLDVTLPDYHMGGQLVVMTSKDGSDLIHCLDPINSPFIKPTGTEIINGTSFTMSTLTTSSTDKYFQTLQNGTCYVIVESSTGDSHSTASDQVEIDSLLNSITASFKII